MSSALHDHLAKTIEQGKSLWRPPNGRYEIGQSLLVPAAITDVDLRGVEIVTPARPDFRGVEILGNVGGLVQGGSIAERDGRNQSGGGGACIALVGCSGTRLVNTETSGGGRGVLLQDGRGLRLTGLSVGAAWSYGVEIRACTGTMIDRCAVRHTWRDGYKVTFGSAGLLVQDSRASNCGRGQAVDPANVNGDGIDIFGGTDITLLRFEAHSCTHGINIKTAEGVSSARVQIIDCACEGNRKHGGYVNSENNNHIELIDDVVVMGGRFKHNGMADLRVSRGRRVQLLGTIDAPRVELDAAEGEPILDLRGAGALDKLEVAR